MEANDQTAVNAKRFRKVANMIRRLIDHIRKEKYLPEKLARDTFDQVDDLAKEALIAPPRNCDVGTLTEQQQRFRDFCEKMQHTDKACCGGCPIVHLRMKDVISNSCEIAWAQMPYEEGGAK